MKSARVLTIFLAPIILVLSVIYLCRQKIINIIFLNQEVNFDQALSLIEILEI